MQALHAINSNPYNLKLDHKEKEIPGIAGKASLEFAKEYQKIISTFLEACNTSGVVISKHNLIQKGLTTKLQDLPKPLPSIATAAGSDISKTGAKSLEDTLALLNYAIQTYENKIQEAEKRDTTSDVDREPLPAEEGFEFVGDPYQEAEAPPPKEPPQKTEEQTVISDTDTDSPIFEGEFDELMRGIQTPSPAEEAPPLEQQTQTTDYTQEQDEREKLREKYKEHHEEATVPNKAAVTEDKKPAHAAEAPPLEQPTQTVDQTQEQDEREKLRKKFEEHHEEATVPDEAAITEDKKPAHAAEAPPLVQPTQTVDKQATEFIRKIRFNEGFNRQGKGIDRLDTQNIHEDVSQELIRCLEKQNPLQEIKSSAKIQAFKTEQTAYARTGQQKLVTRFQKQLLKIITDIEKHYTNQAAEKEKEQRRAREKSRADSQASRPHTPGMND